MYRDMVARIIAKCDEGAKLEDLTPGDILDMDAAVLGKLVMEDKRTAGGATGNAMNIRFAYVESRETYGVSGQLRGAGTEQFTDEHCDWVILTLAGKRYRKRGNDAEKQASLQTASDLHHAWNEAFAGFEKMALVTVNKNSESPDPGWFAAGREDVIEVILPKSYSANEVTVLGQQMRSCVPEWTGVPAGAVPAVQDGVTVAHAYKVGEVTHVRVMVAPTALFEASGKLVTGGVTDAVRAWCRMIATFAVNPGEITEVREENDPTEEDREAYNAAKLMLSMTKASVKDNTGAVRRLKERVNNANARLEELMENFINQQRQAQKDASELAKLEASGESAIAQATGHLLAEYDKIIESAPVKDAKLFERGGDTIIRLDLHPLVVDTEEQRRIDEGTAGTGRGEPHHRLFEHLSFELNLSTGSDRPTDIVKWIQPKPGTLKDGFDPRAHPHSYEGGGSCWGMLGTAFAQALANREWYTAVQWFFNYCANVDTDPGHDHHCKLWTFPPAPDGMEPGWVLPGTERAAMLEGWDPDPTYGEYAKQVATA